MGNVWGPFDDEEGVMARGSMIWSRVVLCAAAAAGVALTSAVAGADAPVPAVGSPCPAELAQAMTLLDDGRTYMRCEPGVGYAWAEVQTPFDPQDAWLSYGPPITLHGQGMRNPNLSSGRWTATPQDPETICRAVQTTVVEAGVLATPVVSEGEQGQPLALEMLPKLFYAELSGDCLWVRD